MARKDPFRTINVRKKIIEALEPLRLKESAGEMREWSVNGFCEKILWDYAQGKLLRKDESAASTQPTLAALFEVDPKALTEEQVELIVELGRRVQQKFDSEEDLSRTRKRKSA